MPTHRNQLGEVLSRIDGVILEAHSHVENPDDTDSQERAARVLDDMERARLEVEGELRGQ